MRVWTVSQKKAGTLTQCLGVARHLDPEPKIIEIDKKLPRWRLGLLSPYRSMSQPEPDIIISCGYMATRHVAAIASACKLRPLTVHLQKLKPEDLDCYDLAFISRHDWTEDRARLPNSRQMTGVPHQFTVSRIENERPAARQRWAAAGRPVLAVLVGGPNEAYRYDGDTIDRLADAIGAMAASGWTVLVSTSRRSTPETLPRLLDIKDGNVFVWDRTGDNPYSGFMAAADAYLITKDTITMTCEALASGRPVYIFDLPNNPCEKLDTFEGFHADFSDTLGLTRPFEGQIEAYTYAPLDEARRIANILRDSVEARTSRGEPSAKRRRERRP